jgi:hypothetical protein
MSTYHFDIDSDGAATTEIVEAADQNAAIRQALLLVSEILRDHGLSSHTAISLRICVRGEAGQMVWSGCASGRQPGSEVEQAATRGAS